MKVFFRLFRYLSPYKFPYFICLTLIAVISGFELLKPWPLKIAVDQVINKEPLVLFNWTVPLADYSTNFQLLFVAISLIGVNLVWGILSFIQNYVTIHIGQDMVQDFRRDLFFHLQRQSLLFHQNRPAGDIIYRLTGDTYAVQAILTNVVFTGLSSLVMLLGMGFVLFRLDAELSLYAVAVIPFLLLAIQIVSKHIGALSTQTYTADAQVFSTVERIFTSINIIQAFAREEEERKRFLGESQRSFDMKLKLYSMQTFYGWLVAFITIVGTAWVLYVGVYHVLKGSITTGELLIFLGYLASLYQPLNNLAVTAGTARGAIAQAERVMEVLDKDFSVPEKPGAPDIVIPKGEVVFDNVSFGYTEDKMVFKNISFTIPGGSTVAIVGPTGAGKTTLVSLLLRFYDPIDGAIKLDGQDLRDVKVKSVREAVAIVLQDVQLFPVSIHDNIAYGKKNATRDDVIEAATMANGHEFIVNQPKGYDTILGERGSTISGGQRQRIAIARALLKNAPVLVLDEPTSALDAATEAAILENFDKLVTGRTTFIIAHRLSTVRRANLIMVIKDGTLAEMGSYEELMSQEHGEFRKLHDLQFGGSEKDKLPVVMADPAAHKA